jgi:3'(2'), 5'-bisphosphate nucleotidase
MNRLIAERMLQIARDASVVVNHVYHGPFRVDYKDHGDPVTAADQWANELICERLHLYYPNVHIVAEESAPANSTEYRQAERVFFVDPLDGTREFIARNGEFVIMIGLVDGDRPTIGVIHAPARGVSWVGIVGEGAWQVDKRGVESTIRVSAVDALCRAKIVVSRSHRSEALDRAEGTLGVAETIAMGSAGLKGSCVATGVAEAYVAPNYAGKRWDACAVEAIVCAAGGRFTDASGTPIDYRAPSLDNDSGLVASNGLLHDLLIERLALARAAPPA